jgi:hypothetical protein
MNCSGALILLALPILATAQAVSDPSIQTAIDRGMSTDATVLWKQINKQHRVKVTRGGLIDPVEKFVTFVGDLDRIALIAAERKRKMQTLSVGEVKAAVPLNAWEVRLETAVIQSNIAALPNWTLPEVHMVLKVDGQIMQPTAIGSGPHSSTNWGQTGVVLRNGPIATYVPLYADGSDSVAAWFRFSVAAQRKTLSVVIIPGNGKPKEKAIERKFLPEPGIE